MDGFFSENLIEVEEKCLTNDSAAMAEKVVEEEKVRDEKKKN